MESIIKSKKVIIELLNIKGISTTAENIKITIDYINNNMIDILSNPRSEHDSRLYI